MKIAKCAKKMCKTWLAQGFQQRYEPQEETGLEVHLSSAS